MEGETLANRGNGGWPAYTAGNGQPGRDGGGTIVTATTEPTNDDWENIFGPAGRDVKWDVQRYKRDGRLHLPSVLEGVNHYLTDRVDGLITDATNSPFTTVILPYEYLHNPDAKFTWNRYSFDEGLASRVPYESAARTLAQTRRSYEGYTVRQGLAITMEHNFMMSPAGRENFFNKWWQVVGSIQKTNDLDVHIALLAAPSYAIEVKNKYYSRTKTPHQIIREHVDMFGFLQKNVNALDILIEDAKITLQTWGAQAPSFMLCNSKLTMQLTMTPEKTNFITQGYDGLRRLKSGPMLDSYRGLAIIHSRQYSLETGAPPRDLLRRRVRVAEYYRIPWQQAIGNGDRVMLDLYDESKDTFFTVSWKELLHHAALDEADVAKFNSLGQGALATDVTFQAAMYANPATQRDLTYVVRPRTDRQAGRQANNQNVGNTTEQERHATWVGEVGAHSTDNMGLVLTTNTMQMVRSPANDQRTREEVRSFYKASGWFNGTGLMEGFYFCPIYVRTMQGVYFQRLPGIQTIDLYTNPNVAFVAQPIGVQRAIFKALYSGYSVRRPNIPGQDYTVNRVMYGMRPNLHVGRMVFVDRRPDAMRFKHVAAHVMAQCVVTRQLAIRLMQQADTIEKNAAGNVPPESLGIIRAIADMFGMEDEARCLQGSYGLYTSVLAYMAAAVLHPDMELRAYCTRKLKENVSLDVGDMGDVLAIWLKVFINATPLPRQGSESPTFDPFDQGLVLARHFERVKNPELDANDELDAGLRDRLPVMYLGEMPSPEAVRAQTDRVCAAAFPNAAGGVADEVERLQAIELGDWKDRPDEYAMHRDVKSACFKHRSAYVFPDGRAKVKPQDIIAVTRTATAQDALIAFVQIMCKRFFTHEQELYVELNAQANENMPNAAATAEQFNGVTRRALTSNTYPTMFAGVIGELEQEQRWEVVVVRPNIEHNMLAAILGRGGSEALGSTYWGQTELSCYDDSMHGIWGMSYKYHERAMVTNEKNLIRLFDIAYDGYNGGKDDTFVSWTEESGHRSYRTLKAESANTTVPYTGPSLMVMAFPINTKDRLWERNWPSPIVFHESSPGQPLMQEPNYVLDPDNVERVFDERMRVFGQLYNRDSMDPVQSQRYRRYYDKMPKFTYMHTTKKSAGQAVAENESTGNSLAFQGTYRVWKEPGEGGGGGGTIIMDVKGSGHHGVDYVGVASVRSGKGYKITGENLSAVRQI